MSRFWYIIYILLQVTWGLLQSLLGFIILLKHAGDPHIFYRGCILTKWQYTSGLSLGLFIFTPFEAGKSGDRLIVHEYGHTFQSLILGPFYLFVIGVPSLSWARLERYKRIRASRGLSYSHYWTEKWADKLGEKATGLPSIREKRKKNS